MVKNLSKMVSGLSIHVWVEVNAVQFFYQTFVGMYTTPHILNVFDKMPLLPIVNIKVIY
jgi:hypothetical protein